VRPVLDLRDGLLAEYDTGDALAAAVERLGEAGFADVETYSPYLAPAVEHVMGRPRTWLTVVMFVAGLTGAVFGYWLQWYTAAVNYVLDVGGRPAHAAPAFVLITFESLVLFSACAGFVAFFWAVGLPTYWHREFEIPGFERATVDRFWIGVSAGDPRFDAERVRALLDSRDAPPLRIVVLRSAAGETA
jgi:hypothetical protein